MIRHTLTVCANFQIPGMQLPGQMMSQMMPQMMMRLPHQALLNSQMMRPLPPGKSIN